MAKKGNGVFNQAIDDRFTTNGRGIVKTTPTAANKKAVAQINAENAKKKPSTKKK